MSSAQKKNARNPNLLLPEESEPFRAILEAKYHSTDGNGAEVGRWIGLSGSGISQLLARKTNMSIDTCRRIASKVGKGIYVGLTGNEPPPGMRTIGSDEASRDALTAAARDYKLPPWVVAALYSTVIPESWPSLTPAIVFDLASVWLKWEDRVGSRVRRKVSQS